jgi:hypothetical protein
VFAKLADAGAFSVSQLASVLWSLAVLGRSSEPLPMSQQLQVLVGLQALAAASNGTGLKQLGPAGRSALAWSLASLGVTPSKPWLAQYLSAAFEGGLASDQLRCANVLFCIASVDFEYLVEWLGDFLQGADSAGSSGGLDLSLAKYAALAGVLGALGEMDSRQLRAAWLDASGTEWWVAEFPVLLLLLSYFAKHCQHRVIFGDGNGVVLRNASSKHIICSH